MKSLDSFNYKYPKNNNINTKLTPKQKQEISITETYDGESRNNLKSNRKPIRITNPKYSTYTNNLNEILECVTSPNDLSESVSGLLPSKINQFTNRIKLKASNLKLILPYSPNKLQTKNNNKRDIHHTYTNNNVIRNLKSSQNTEKISGKDTKGALTNKLSYVNIRSL